MTNGDYVYIMSTLSDVQDQGTDYWLQGKGGIVNENESKKALQSVLVDFGVSSVTVSQCSCPSPTGKIDEQCFHHKSH